MRIEIDGFAGDVEIYLDVSDIVRFQEELNRMNENVAGVAEIKTLENQFYLSLEMDNLGHVEASGFLCDGERSNKLSFEFSFDQTFLARTIPEIDAALRELAT